MRVGGAGRDGVGSEGHCPGKAFFKVGEPLVLKEKAGTPEEWKHRGRVVRAETISSRGRDVCFTREREESQCQLFASRMKRFRTLEEESSLTFHPKMIPGQRLGKVESFVGP